MTKKALVQNNNSLKQCKKFVKPRKSHWRKNNHRWQDKYTCLSHHFNQVWVTYQALGLKKENNICGGWIKRLWKIKGLEF